MARSFKVVVTVPAEQADSLRQTIGEAGAGTVGNYSFCSFSSIGIGRFKPENGAQPTIGQVGNLEQVTEERIEVNCLEEGLKPLIAAIKANHPYEEPVIDIYELADLP